MLSFASFASLLRLSRPEFLSWIGLVLKKPRQAGLFESERALSSRRDVHGVLVQSAFVGKAHMACC